MFIDDKIRTIALQCQSATCTVTLLYDIQFVYDFVHTIIVPNVINIVRNYSMNVLMVKLEYSFWAFMT